MHAVQFSSCLHCLTLTLSSNNRVCNNICLKLAPCYLLRSVQCEAACYLLQLICIACLLCTVLIGCTHAGTALSGTALCMLVLMLTST